jgi:hypothetical protein
VSVCCDGVCHTQHGVVCRVGAGYMQLESSLASSRPAHCLDCAAVVYVLLCMCCCVPQDAAEKAAAKIIAAAAAAAAAGSSKGKGKGGKTASDAPAVSALHQVRTLGDTVCT